MATPTNVIALVDNEFHHRIDRELETRDGAYKIYNWMITKGVKSQHLTEHFMGHLINEVFRLRRQNEELLKQQANKAA